MPRKQRTEYKKNIIHLYGILNRIYQIMPFLIFPDEYYMLK